MKKLISLLLVLAFAFGMVGCANNGEMEQYTKRPNHVKVIYFAGGYGEEWMPAIAKYYMDNVDKETYVEIKHTVLPTEEGQKVITGLSDGDLVMVSYAMFRQSGYLHDLTDLYAEKIQGEDTTLAEKTMQTQLDYYNENGKYYQVGLAQTQVIRSHIIRRRLTIFSVKEVTLCQEQPTNCLSLATH